MEPGAVFSAHSKARRCRRRPGALALLLALSLPLAPTVFAATTALSPPTVRDPEGEGLELATRLRNTPPAESSEVRGVLEMIRGNGPLRSVPLTCTITLASNRWQVVYCARDTNAAGGGPVETLTISHSPDQPGVYQWIQSTNQKERATSPVSLTQPFAGSDFWIQDLGLEFLHWPNQRILRAEMRRNRSCRVLQSTLPHPPPNGYARVLSWVDLETGGIIQAEAYDAQGKLFKKFALGSFEKVEGRWQLRNMKIRNARTGSQTDLKFELNKPGA